MKKPLTAHPEAPGEVISCSIKMLPEDQLVAAAKTAISINPSNAPAAQQYAQAMGKVLPPAHLAVLTTKRWPSTGVNLTVGFIGSVPADLQTRIVSHMNAWGQYCNAKFTPTNSNPQVRISLTGRGYWSYLGTDILHIAAGQATMNLQGFSMNTSESEFHRVVRHETGHTLGFPHEHMRSEIVARIDPAKAKAHFLASDGWDAATVTAQVLTPIADSALLATAHADPNSIMCYWLPASIMKDNVAVPGGLDIDPQDQQFSNVVYPKPIKPAIKDFKDSKLEKVEKNEFKEHKTEKQEHKEKIEKIERKEKIEKLERPEKNPRFERKQFDKINDGFPFVHPGVGPIQRDFGQPEQASDDLEMRIQQLEISIANLSSFIESALRPDLSEGGLSNE